MYRKKSYGSKPVSYMEKTTYGYKGKPSGDTYVHPELSIKALRDLPHSSYAIKADPYEAALPTSEPYPLLNKLNRAINPSYSGDDNIDGGNVQQYANSVTSKFLNYFDVFRTEVNVNYRYLPILPDANKKGYGLIDEMRKSIAETVSILKSTTFTQMAINHFAVVTDLPMGSATTTNIAPSGDTEVQAYTNLTDVLYAMAIYYQIVLQDALGVMNWHNSFRLKQGVSIRNAWGREVPNLNSFYGLMNKKSFLNLLDTIALSFEGEYIDRAFMEQMNALSLVPSRRSDSITDPVLELQVGWNHPSTFKIYILNDNGEYISSTPFFSDARDMVAIIPGREDEQHRPLYQTFWDACEDARDLLSLEATTLWARSNYNAGVVTTTDNARFNAVKDALGVINTCFVQFKPLWADFREAFDVMARTGTLSWTKGFRPSIVKETTCDLFQNLIVDDIYNMIFSGADEISFDSATKRWRYFSKWNMYHGIPLYDVKSGGSFLSFSFKSAYNVAETEVENLAYLPILFTYGLAGATCAAVSRDGVEAAVTYNAELISANAILSRLAPLQSQNALTMRVAGVEGTTTITSDHLSTLYKTLTQVFGAARIKAGVDDVWDYALDPDIIAIYQIEITDISNMAITYARANAPFRGTTSSADLLGFRSSTN